MKLEKRFEAIENLLLDHQYLLDKEVLQRYPNLSAPYHEWGKSIATFTDEELIQLENLQFQELNLPDDYRLMLDKISSLLKLDQAEYRPQQIPKEHLKKMTLKKRHEIEILQGQLEEDQSFVDIGSGAAHLSGVLLEGNDKTSICIDMDSDIQSIGKKKHAKILDRLQFETLKFHRHADLFGNPSDTLIGLHACGDLSCDIIEYGIHHKFKKIVSYGCCFHKLSQFPMSKQTNLKVSNHALTMAAKSYKTMTLKEFQQREKVKRFRYTLHFLMFEHMDGGFVTLGNASKADYEGAFHEYCYKYLPETKKFTPEFLTDFFTSKKDEYREYLCFGIIRSHLSRLLEVFINLDRCLYLKEQGYNVKLEEVFDRKLSPRNLCITAVLERS